MNSKGQLKRAGAFLVLALYCALAQAQQGEPAGKVTFLEGDAWVEQGIARNPLETGSIVYTGDQLRTGEDANLYIRFLDQTFFALGPEAKMTVEAYDEREQAESNFVTSIFKGAFRFVSGLLAREQPQKFRVNIAVGTIGVRGTNVAGEVFERSQSEDGSLIEASAQVMLLEDEEGEDTAIEVFNQFGSVIIDEPGFGTEIPDESSPPSPVRRMQIRTVNNLLRAIRNTTRSSTQRRRLP